MVDVFFVQFIDGVDVPVIIQRRGLLSVLGKVVDMPVASKDRCLGLLYRTVEFAQLHVDVCCPVHRRYGRPCAHAETWFAVLDTVVCMLVVSNDMCLGVTVQITVEVPPLHVEVCWCSSSTVVDVPVLMQGRVLQFLDKVVYMLLRPMIGA